MSSPDLNEVRKLVNDRLDELSPGLRDISLALHGNPELAYKEVFAHEKITEYVEKLGFSVQRKTYGLDTSFEVSIGEGGRLAVFCAEYDALPEIGHACGHNLIAISGIGAFLGAAHALAALGIPGRLRLLGTPAEEGGGGKILMINAGAFKPEHGIAAAIMAHPASSQVISSDTAVKGCAAFDLIASIKFRVEFRGEAAHAALEPWNGVNALDAAVSAYNAVSVLRQQIRPEERIHGVIEAGGTVPNIITDYTRMNWYIRAPDIAQAARLEVRVKKCMEAAGLATGCSVNFIDANAYKDVKSNRHLCDAYVENMKNLGENVISDPTIAMNASTDMGNVSYEVPSIHASFIIPTEPGVALHSKGFAAGAGTEGAHEAAIKSAKGMAMLGLNVVIDEATANAVKREFDETIGRQ